MSNLDFNTNPIERVVIHENKVMGTWGHHGIQAPALQILWNGKQDFEEFTSEIDGWTPT